MTFLRIDTYLPSPHYSVLFSVNIPGDFTLLSISDDGGGMDEDVQSNMFEPFSAKELGVKVHEVLKSDEKILA